MTSTPLTSAARKVVFSTLLVLLPLSTGRTATFELDIKELDKAQPARKEPRKHTSSRKSSSGGAPKTESAGSAGVIKGEQRYTVKQGDHIFKILMRELGLSNNEAERLLPDVAKINDIKDLRKLSVGQVLLLPSTKQRPRKQQIAKQEQPGEATVQKRTSVDTKTAPAIRTEAAPEPAKEETPVEATAPLPTAQPAPEQHAAPQPAINLASVKVRPIASANTEEMIDSLLTALEIKAEKKRIVETSYGGSGGSILSIKVDRYFEENGKRFIVNCTAKDQFNLTLLRLLEREGYRVIQAERHDFRKVAGDLLAQLGRPYDYVVRKEGLEAGRQELPGYLVGDGEADRQLFLTDSTAD